MEKLLADLDTVLHESGLSGLSFYRLRVHGDLALSQQLKEGRLPAVPDEAGCFDLHRQGESYLESAGAKRLSVKHFALTPRERNLHNELSAYKGACLPFGAGAGGRLGNYRFKQCSDLKTYAEKVRSGVKPMENAGEFPADYPLGAKISHQLYRSMAVRTAELESVIPENVRPAVMASLAETLRKQTDQGYFTDLGSDYRLTAKGRFFYASLGSELMEAAASVWQGA